MRLPPYGRLPRFGDAKFSWRPNDKDHGGWLLLSDAARIVSRAAYPDLFEAIGETYGTGDGKTTFALPTPGGLFLMMATAATATRIGAKGGAKEQTLTLDNVPEHSHEETTASVAATQPQRALLATTLLGVSTGDITKPPTTTVSKAQTSKVGKAAPTPVPTIPPYIAISAFIYAGMPKT